MIKKESKVRKYFQFSKVKFLIGFVMFLLIFIGYLYSKNNGSFLGSSGPQQPTPTITAVEVGCTRTTRLENSPQYDRALSILNQRVGENVEWWEKYGEKNKPDTNKFTRFPAQLTNCIKIIERDINNGAEGYFTLNSDDIKPNYYPITIDRGYYYMDDVIISLLLAHELTHVQQYIEAKQVKNEFSCIDKEVDAFMTQMDYYITLNSGEISSIVSRMEENTKDLHPQILMIKAMTTINRESGCDWSTKDVGQSCRDVNLRNELTKMISEDEFYKKQCQI